MKADEKYYLQWLVKEGFMEPEDMKGLNDEQLAKLVRRLIGREDHVRKM